MRCYVVEESDGRQIVVGYHRPRRQVFGLVYGDAPNGRNRRGPIGGWPSRTGLGMDPPLTTEAQARQAILLLTAWLRGQAVRPDRIALAGDILLREWREDVP